MSKAVLIVDDNADLRSAMRHEFEGNCSFQVCGEAIDGRDAIQKARQLKPDLIILDFSMPVMNGIEAARILNQEMPSIPLILFTMHTSVVMESIAREAGFRAVVSKSQDINLLVTQSQILLGILSVPSPD